MRRIQGSSGRVARLTSVARNAIRLHEVARRRASGVAHRARETSAPMGIISPTLIEIVKNMSTVARPTPAVRLGSPSQEM